MILSAEKIMKVLPFTFQAMPFPFQAMPFPFQVIPYGSTKIADFEILEL